jgi:hypothetical protein
VFDNELRLSITFQAKVSEAAVIGSAIVNQTTIETIVNDSEVVLSPSSGIVIVAATVSQSFMPIAPMGSP